MEANTSNQILNEVINGGEPVYISYAGNSSEKPEWEHIADGVEDLKRALEAANIQYSTRLEKSDDKVSDFEKQIGESEVVVLVFSDRYFRTEHCMYEFVEIKKSFQKHPNKKLLCIKSGTFNLSDVNYILEVEHFWGDERQEYGEIDFHQMRQHTEQEEAAKKNDFYIDDVRHLYSFFSSTNYLNMESVDWKSFADDIINYYNARNNIKKLTLATKNFFKKKWSLTTKLFLWGFASMVLLLFGIDIYADYIYETPASMVEYPGYLQNDYAQEGGILTRISVDNERTILHFSFPYSYKDTMPFSKDTHKLKLLDKYETLSPDTLDLIEIKANLFSSDKDSSITGHNGATADFIVVFEAADGYSLDFIDGDKGIYDIKYNQNHLATIQHPEYERGIDNCYINKIELNKDNTKMYFRIVNESETDSVVYASDDAYILAKGKKYYLDCASGIPIYPNRTKLAKGASMDFAMMFPSIPPDTEFIHFVSGDYGIFGLKLQRQTIKEVTHPKSQTKYRNFLITKIEVNEGETILHFRYFNRSGDGLKWHTPHNSYIVAGHNKYELKGSSGLPSKPDSTVTRLDFALIYPPIPAETTKMDCVIYEDFDDKEFIGFYDLELSPKK